MVCTYGVWREAGNTLTIYIIDSLKKNNCAANQMVGLQLDIVSVRGKVRRGIAKYLWLIHVGTRDIIKICSDWFKDAELPGGFNGTNRKMKAVMYLAQLSRNKCKPDL
jgi:hypothetical protein